MDDILERMAHLAEEAKDQQERYRNILNSEESRPGESARVEIREEKIVVQGVQPGQESLEECMEASRLALKDLHDRDESSIIPGQTSKEAEGLSPTIPSPRRLVRSAIGAVSHKAQDYFEGAKEKANQAYAATQDTAQHAYDRARNSFVIVTDTPSPPTEGGESSRADASVERSGPQAVGIDPSAIEKAPSKDDAYAGKPFEGETIQQAVEFNEHAKELLEREEDVPEEDIAKNEEAENTRAVLKPGGYAEVVASIAAEMIGLEHEEMRFTKVEVLEKEREHGKVKVTEHDGHQPAHSWQKVRDLVLSKHKSDIDETSREERPASVGLLLSRMKEDDEEKSVVGNLGEYPSAPDAEEKGAPEPNTAEEKEEPVSEDTTYHEATVMQTSLS